MFDLFHRLEYLEVLTIRRTRPPSHGPADTPKAIEGVYEDFTCCFLCTLLLSLLGSSC